MEIFYGKVVGLGISIPPENKTFGLLVFLVGIKRKHWPKMC